MADPAQHDKKARFWFGNCISWRGGLFPGIHSAEGHEVTFSGYCSAVKNIPVWCVFLTHSVTSSGLREEYFYSRYQHLSLVSYSFVPFCSMVHSPVPKDCMCQSLSAVSTYLNWTIAVINIANLRSLTQFHPQMPMGHTVLLSSPPPPHLPRSWLYHSFILVLSSCMVQFLRLSIFDAGRVKWVLRDVLRIEVSRAVAKVKGEYTFLSLVTIQILWQGLWRSGPDDPARLFQFCFSSLLKDCGSLAKGK